MTMRQSAMASPRAARALLAWCRPFSVPAHPNPHLSCQPRGPRGLFAPSCLAPLSSLDSMLLTSAAADPPPLRVMDGEQLHTSPDPRSQPRLQLLLVRAGRPGRFIPAESSVRGLILAENVYHIMIDLVGLTVPWAR